MDNQKMLKKIRNQMLDEGFSEYDWNGSVTSESSAAWNAEFARRLAVYGNK